MQKKILSLLVCSFFFYPLVAQPLKMIDEEAKAVSFNINIPVGQFADTHFGGFGFEYGSARQWQGKIRTRKKARFAYNGGLTYYFGKKETVSGYDYKYPGFLFIHAFGGILYTPLKLKKLDTRLTAGPALGIYDGTARFNFGSKLEAGYFLSWRVSIGPGIILMKEPGADPLWSAFLKATMLLN